MGKVLHPDSIASTLANMQRQIDALSAAQRVGLNRIQVAYSVIEQHETVLGSWSDGVASGRTWEALNGSTGTGYPLVTITGIGTRCVILASGLVQGLANSVGFQSAFGAFGISINGATPSPPGVGTQLFNNLTPDMSLTPAYSGVFTTIAATTTFRLEVNFTSAHPAAAVPPDYWFSTLVVIPLN